MTDKQIIIKDYFNILRDEYGRIYCIQDIGDPKSLIKAIREQNEYIQAKDQECEELKKQVRGLRPELKSIIDKICCKYNIEAKNYHEKIIEIINNLDKYKQALDEIEKLIPKFDTSDGCSYGDYDCENCSDLDEDIVCTYKLKKVIKGITNKAKGEQ